MAAPWQGLPVRLARAPHRGAAFALSNASKRARTRSIGSRSRGLLFIFRSSPAVVPPHRGAAFLPPAGATVPPSLPAVVPPHRGAAFLPVQGVYCSFFDHPPRSFRRRPQARPFRLRFARVVAVFPVSVNLAPAVRHGRTPARLARPFRAGATSRSGVCL